MHHLEYGLMEYSNTEMSKLEEKSLDVMWEGRKGTCFGFQKYGSWSPLASVWLQHPLQPVIGSQTFLHRYPYLQRGANKLLAQGFEGEPGATSYNHNFPFKILCFAVKIYLDLCSNFMSSWFLNF